MVRLIDRLVRRLGSSTAADWFIVFGTFLLVVGVVVVLLEYASRQAPWPPVSGFRVELAEREVEIGGTLPVAISYRMEREGCYRFVQWEMWTEPGLWLELGYEARRAPEPGPVMEIVALPIAVDTELGRHALRVVTLFDCPSFVFFGGRQYHKEARGLGWFTVTEAQPE